MNGRYLGREEWLGVLGVSLPESTLSEKFLPMNLKFSSEKAVKCGCVYRYISISRDAIVYVGAASLGWQGSRLPIMVSRRCKFGLHEGSFFILKNFFVSRITSYVIFFEPDAI